MHHVLETPPGKIPTDLTLVIPVSRGATYERSRLLLAKATFNGTLELLTAAWGLVLGYSAEEFMGKTLRQLMGSNDGAAARAVAEILDVRNTEPVDLTVQRRDGTAERLRFYRRFDDYIKEMFIVAEDTNYELAQRLRTYRASGTLK